MTIKRGTEQMRLLPLEQLICTSAVDHADWNYRPLLAHIMRRRYALLRSLLPSKRVGRLLEVGFGSGIFLPDLAFRCHELYGIDIHPRIDSVQASLADVGVYPKISKQDASRTTFLNEFFDVIVSLSALEFVENIGEAASECARILRKGGRLIAVMPGKSALLDFALRVMTGEDARRDYGSRREQVLPALLNHFRIVRTRKFAPIYTAYELERL